MLDLDDIRDFERGESEFHEPRIANLTGCRQNSVNTHMKIIMVVLAGLLAFVLAVGLWALGVYKAINNCLGFFGFWFSGRIVDRFKETYVLAIQQAYWLVSQTIGLILSNVMSPLLFMSSSIIFGPGIVARDHLLQKEFTDEQRATMGSVATLAGSIVYAITALCIGIIADHFVWVGVEGC